jgi:hypothetical protein
VTLHDHPGFRVLGLEPFSRGYSMIRTGGPTGLSSREYYFTTRALVAAYRKPAWSAEQGVFLGLHLTHDAPLVVGAFFVPNADLGTQVDLAVYLGKAELCEPEGLTSPLREAPGGVLPECSRDWVEFRYAAAPWQADSADVDIDWAIENLRDAVAVWDGTPSAQPSSPSTPS